MNQSKVCSELVNSVLELRIKCGHCESINFVTEEYDPNDTDMSKMDIEAIQCWNCGKESLIDEELLGIYPSGTDEQVNIVDGQEKGAYP